MHGRTKHGDFDWSDSRMGSYRNYLWKGRRKMKAVELLSPSHPVHRHFVQWAAGRELTKRLARRFLQEFPKYREIPEQTSASPKGWEKI